MIRNTRLIKSAISALLLLQAILFAAVILSACSESKVAGGNSSEVGSPELSGTLAFISDSQKSKTARAAFARVYCVPVDYDPAKEDSTAYYSTIADSAGKFIFDSIPDGIYNLEAFFEDSQKKSFAIRETGIKISADSTWNADLEMSESQSIRVYFSDTKDSVANMSIVGSIYKSTAKISTKSDLLLQYATFTGIAPSFYDSIQISTSAGLQNIKAVLVENTDAIQEFFYEDESIHALEIPLNTAATGINLQDTLYGFPLFIRLSDIDSLNRNSIIKNLSALRIYQEPFSDMARPKAIYGKDSVPTGLWIHLSKLYPQKETQKIVIYWNDATKEISDSSKAAEPFSMQDGFIAAWNFNEEEFSESTVYTAGDNYFEGHVNDITASEGIIGGAFYFNGKTSYIEIQNSASEPLFAFKDTSSFTVTFWALAEDTSTARFLWGKSEAEYHFKYQATGKNPACWMFKEFDESNPEEWYESSITADPESDYKQWVHFTVIKDGDSTAIYRNGKLEKVTTGYNQTDEERVAKGPFVIGARKLANENIDRVFKGKIDELYIQNKAQPNEWARLIYLNQRPKDYWPKIE